MRTARCLRSTMKPGESGVQPVEYKDYYQTLGVARDASADAIKKAYRKLVRKHHPDVSRARDAGERTKEINEAYEVLGNAGKRAAYDALGRAPAGQEFHPPPGWDTQFANAGADGFGSGDFFADLFAHVGRRRRAGGGFAVRGDDIHASVMVDLHDAYHGAERTLTLRVPGRDEHGRAQTRERALTMRIPKGVLPGQQLRLAGQGHAGTGGGPPGDLFLEIQFHTDKRYRVEARNVHETVPVAPWEAALGAHIDVPTPSGHVQVSVPAGSQSGRKLRLKGRGIPGAPAGDLYLILEVVLPPASSERARDLYRAMERDLAFNPRAGARA